MKFHDEDENRNNELKITLNDKDEVVGYAIIGGISGEIGVSYEKAPANFVEVFSPKYFLYKNGELKVNPNYKEPINEM
ncbi:DUF2977 domain-containing protein [Staphylococcus sp. 50Mo3-1]|uniref:DUF2977 domain-containing protein n=1 Tax=Staphylococcus sp. 50Mo3-2 TaxID=3135642 RepID=UPI0033ECEF6A